MIEAVVFDLFGVLSANQPAAIKAELAGALQAEPVQFWRQYWRFRPAYDVAELSDAAYWTAVATALGKPLDDRLLARLCRLDDASWSGENPPAIEFARELAGTGLPLGLLSNIPARLAEHLFARHRWLQLFDVTGLSCRLGVGKPDPAPFRWLVRQFGTAPDRLLYIDDRAENVAAAASLGLATVRFETTAELRDHWRRLQGSSERTLTETTLPQRTQ